MSKFSANAFVIYFVLIVYATRRFTHIYLVININVYCEKVLFNGMNLL